MKTADELAREHAESEGDNGNAEISFKAGYAARDEELGKTQALNDLVARGYLVTIRPQVIGCHTITISKNGRHASVGWMPEEFSLDEELSRAIDAWSTFHGDGENDE